MAAGNTSLDSSLYSSLVTGASLGVFLGAFLGTFLGALAVLISIPAFAGLGDYASQVTHESSALKAKSVVRKAETLYSVQELDTGGALVREYANTEGVIFAVTWKGLATPDLPTILGSYYTEYATAQAQATKDASTRRLQVVKTSNIAVLRAGHMRAWRGRASVASLVPAGVNVETLP